MTKKIGYRASNIVLALTLGLEAAIKIAAFLAVFTYAIPYFIWEVYVMKNEDTKAPEWAKCLGRYSTKWSLADEGNWPIGRDLVKRRILGIY